VSISGDKTRADNTDRVSPSFNTDMFNNPGARFNNHE